MDPTASQISRRPYRLILMWRGDPKAPNQPNKYEARMQPMMAALRAAGIEPVPLCYFDEQAERARVALGAADGVLTWVNPLADGRDRSIVDHLLRKAAAQGVWVGAHPDVISKMATKEVLYRTRSLGWGTDVELYRSFEDFAARFPAKLSAGPRVLKPLRGNDGQGVVKVELAVGEVRIQAATDDVVGTATLGAFVGGMTHAFAGGKRLIDQAFQPNVGAGMVRCYLSQRRVVGFSEQRPRAAKPSAGAPALGMESAKTMHGAEADAFQDLRRLMEDDWVPGLQRLLGIETASLPALWDADFLCRAEQRPCESRFVLCEINACSVSPFPDVAAPAIAETVRRALDAR